MTLIATLIAPIATLLALIATLIALIEALKTLILNRILKELNYGTR